MNELGELLKNARLKKGMTLDDLQEVTKIRTRYLKAIEDGDFEVMPALVYAKGFIKSYAEAVGLDPNELLSKYSYLFEVKTENEEESQYIKPDIDKKGDFEIFDILRGLIKPIIGIAIVSIIAIGIYYMVNQINRGLAPLPETSQSRPDTSSKTNDNKKNTTSDNVYGKNEKTTTFSVVNSTKKEVDYKVVPAGDSYKIELTISGQKCWVDVKVDGVSTYQYLMTSGMTKTFDVKNNVEILMGNPPDAKITVDGQEIPHIDVPAPVTVKLENDKGVS